MTEPATPSNNTQAPTNAVTGDPATPPVLTVPPTTQSVPVEAPKADAPPPYAADTGSRQLDVALAHFVNGLGLAPDSAELLELQKSGNLEYIKGYAVQKGKSVEELAPFLALAEGGLKELTANREAANEKIRTELEGYAGSKERFDATIAFVKENSTEEQRAEFSDILDKGGIGAQALLHFFQSKMAADPNVTVRGAEAVAANAGAQATGPAKAYANRDEWRAAQRELIAKHGQRYEQTPEGRALDAAFPG